VVGRHLEAVGSRAGLSGGTSRLPGARRRWAASGGGGRSRSKVTGRYIAVAEQLADRAGQLGHEQAEATVKTGVAVARGR
jgi:hypothetical protein